ncbi:MAG: glycosyltransferase family 2 protein [Pseudolysinimonas sp.]
MHEPQTLTVSVALCTYNGARFVAEQLRGILAQTRPAAQLIVADDGSTDGTLDVVEATVAAHRASHPGSTPALRILTGDRHFGVAANFGRALAAADGDLIALSDQDDVWYPDRLARLVAACEAVPEALLIHSDARLIDEHGTDLGTTLFAALPVAAHELALIHEGRGFEAYIHRNLATGATCIIRRGLRDVALPIPDGWVHDEWLAMLSSALARTDVVEEPLTGYRQHGSNQIGVRRVTLGVRLERLREPREPRNGRLLRRARSLVERLDALDGVMAEKRQAARGKLVHEQRRSALPATRIARVPRVIAGAARGDYARFGNGAQDVLRDIVQPGSERSA